MRSSIQVQHTELKTLIEQKPVQITMFLDLIVMVLPSKLADSPMGRKYPDGSVVRTEAADFFTLDNPDELYKSIVANDTDKLFVELTSSILNKKIPIRKDSIIGFFRSPAVEHTILSTTAGPVQVLEKPSEIFSQ